MTTSQSQSKVSSGSALLGGLLTLWGLACAYRAVMGTLGIVGNVLLVIGALYIIGAVATFWLARYWEDGITADEALGLVKWPLSIRAILKADNLKSGFAGLGIADDSSEVLIADEGIAKLIGAIVSAIALLIAVPMFVGATVGAVGGILVVLVYLHFVGMAAYFWLMDFHKRPFSGGMIVELLIWEFDMFRDLWTRVKNGPATA